MMPAWIDAGAWAAYMEMRKKIKKPMTDYAQKLAIRLLEKLRVEGQDITAVLEQSIFNSWQGLFPVKGSHQNAPDAAQAWLTLRDCIRSNKAPPDAIRSAAQAIGGFHRLQEMTSFDIGKLQGQFESAYKQGAH